MTPSAAPPLLPATRAALDEALARLLEGLLLGVALLLLAAAAIPEVTGDPTVFSRSRPMLAALLVVGAALGWQLRRSGRARAGSLAAMAVVLLGTGVQAAVTGVGLYSLALAGSALVIAFAGALGGLRSALALAGMQALLLLALFAAELRGLGTPAGRLAEVHGVGGLVDHLLLVGCGLLGAAVVSRLVQASVQRAQAGEQRLAELLHIGNDWAWEMDDRGRLTSISAGFEARTGYRVADFLGEAGVDKLLPTRGMPALLDALRARRGFRDVVLEFRAGDGRPLVVQGCGEPRFDADGRFTGFWGVSRNITQEVAAQQALDRTQTLLDRLFRLSPDPIVVARLDGGAIVLANPAFEQLAGMSAAELQGRSGLDLGLWRDAGEPVRLLAALRREGVVRHLRSQAWVGGQERDVLLSAAAFESDGAPVAVISVRDITGTERARLEGDAILDNASVGIAFVRDHRFERVNPAFETMFGCAPGSLAGQPTRVLYPDEAAAEAFWRETDDELLAGRVVDIERKTRRPDGSVLVARLRARAVDASRVRERGTIWITEDITEQRRAERELAEAKQQAEQASRAKSAFLATMSHEIRTPLNGVLGLARLLQDEGLDAARRSLWLGHLTSSAEQLAGIVSDVLDLSKIESGHLEIEQVPFDLRALVGDGFGSFDALGRERGLAMRCDVAPEVPVRVRGDPVRVRQILANYLSNALKFTARGDILLRVAAPRAGMVRFEVHDSGEGVPPEQQERLFRPFAQADGSTTRRYGGTGLGLSICRELAERMGGQVGMQARNGGGSVFWAELALPAEAPPQPQPPVLDDGRPLAGLTVLVAEDNAVNMLIVGTLLRRLGAQVLEAEDGERAVALALDGQGLPDAVLMDLHMPALDGLAATRRLRSVSHTRLLPVFALSAAVLEQERRAAEAAGMNGFVPKPVEEAELLRVLAPLAQAVRKRVSS